MNHSLKDAIKMYLCMIMFIGLILTADDVAAASDIESNIGLTIIAISEADGTDDWKEIKSGLGVYVYQTMQNLQIPESRIKYLGLTSENTIEQSQLTKVNLKNALTEWAISKMFMEDPYQTPIHLYLVGSPEGLDGYKISDDEILTMDELAGYLNETELMLHQRCSSCDGLPITIVIEGTKSEAWIEKLAGNGRIIITSSSEKSVDEGGYAGYDNLGENSFTKDFYLFIKAGKDIEQSFAEANYEILKYYLHTQRPVMDADGDGQGTTRFDRYAASGKHIEYRPTGNLRPKIMAINPNKTVRIGDLIYLWAIATDPEDEEMKVNCSITDSYGNTVDIDLNPDEENMFSSTYDSFNQIGLYEVEYYALDQSGNRSLSVHRFVYVVHRDGYQSEANQSSITAFLADGEGGVWIAIVGYGLFHQHANESCENFDILTYNDKSESDFSLRYQTISTLLSDEEGGIWVGTNEGLAHHRADGTWEIFDEEHSNFPSNHINALLSDNEGGIWIGTDGGLAHQYSDGTWYIFDILNSDLPSNKINALLSDDNGGIWVGTNFGLVHLTK